MITASGVDRRNIENPERDERGRIVNFVIARAEPGIIRLIHQPSGWSVWRSWSGPAKGRLDPSYYPLIRDMQRELWRLI